MGVITQGNTSINTEYIHNLHPSQSCTCNAWIVSVFEFQFEGSYSIPVENRAQADVTLTVNIVVHDGPIHSKDARLARDLETLQAREEYSRAAVEDKLNKLVRCDVLHCPVGTASTPCWGLLVEQRLVLEFRRDISLQSDYPGRRQALIDVETITPQTITLPPPYVLTSGTQAST